MSRVLNQQKEVSGTGSTKRLAIMEAILAGKFLRIPSSAFGMENQITVSPATMENAIENSSEDVAC